MLVLDILAVLALFGWRAWLSARHRNPSTVDEDDQPVPDSSAQQAIATLGWASGTRADWDRHVRPVLAREVAELVRTKPGAGELLLGKELWPWVDPNRPFTEDRDRPGPGHAGLARILDRLERL